MTVSESVVEQAAMEWLAEAGWQTANGAEMIPGEPGAGRDAYTEVVLEGRLRDAIARLNPDLPVEAHADALRQVLRPDAPDLVLSNRAIHKLLVEGVAVEYRHASGDIRGAQCELIDYDDPTSNDWLAINQFTVVENKRTRRPDIVLFVNGLPLGVIELKSAVDEDATIHTAFNQLQTYKSELTNLFAYNAFLIVSDGTLARIGTLTAGWEWYKPWRRMGADEADPVPQPEIQTMVEGVFDRRRVLSLLRDFIVFDDAGDGKPVKKLAGYHQFHAVNVAVGETLRAAAQQGDGLMVAEGDAGFVPSGRHGGDTGDQRIGVIWHTQGSGKSLSMVFYAGRMMREPAMDNPTIVVLTDRNDLDDQLFGTFARCQEVLREPPHQATDRRDLRERLDVKAGGIVFTTIQKFMPDEHGDTHPTLSDRRNIVVMADEAHRSQYDFIDGFARHMRDALPNASFIGFTGTPIELADASTRSVFGDYISVYDIEQAVRDGATVPIYYESRLARLDLDEARKPHIDDDFEEATEGEETDRKERLKTKWAQLEAIVGAGPRLDLVAEDIVQHYEERIEAMEGKALIVCMSRRICVELYDRLIALRPQWAGTNEHDAALRVVMTGSASDPKEWQQHIGTKMQRKSLGDRFKKPDDPFRLVIVRDMWLTGFDAPCLHTMYVDKPMRGHGLMQAITRVNRVFRDKPGGLVVDYLGLAHELKKALNTYTESGGRGRTALDKEEAVALLLEKHEIVCSIFHGFDWSSWATGGGKEKLALIPPAQEFVLAQPDGKDRVLREVSDLTKAFALAVPHPDAQAIRDDVSFFQHVRAALAKQDAANRKPEEELDLAVRQIISRSVASDGVLDVFEAAGLERPDISILSEEFLAEVQGMPHRNLAVEMLQKLLKGEIRSRRQRNVVQARSFAEMLEATLRRYQNRSIEAAQVIQELIDLAREMRQAAARGEELGLTDDEVAFYDALETNDSAVQVLGDDTLRGIARELVETVRANVTIDWTVRENVRAHLRVLVKRILRKYGYPPDKQEKATRTVLEQAEVLCAGWA